jgi:HEAT repeat protein
MGWEDLIDVVGQVQDGVEMGRAEPSKGRIGWCNGIMMYIGLCSTIWLIIPALLFRRSQNGWLKGKHKYPIFALWLGWIMTGVLAIAAPIVLSALLREWSADGVDQAWWLPVVAAVAGVLVIAALVLLLACGIRRFRRERKQAFAEHVPSAALEQAGLENTRGGGVMFCTQCGTPNDDSARFCMKCGTPVGIAASTPVEDPSAFPKQTRQEEPQVQGTRAATPAVAGSSAPRKSWWGRQRKRTKVVLVFAGVIVVVALAAGLAPRIVDALRPSDAQLVQTLVTSADTGERHEAAVDLAARHSLQATQNLVAQVATNATAQEGVAALRDEYIARFGVEMDRENLRKNEIALQETAQCLRLIGDAESIEALGNLSCSLQCDLTSVRVAALHALAETKAAAALPHLIKALALPSSVDPTHDIGEAASAVLLVFPDSVPALIESRAGSADESAHSAIDKTLAGIGESAVQPLVAQLQAMDWTDEILAEIGAPAIPAVTEVLDSDDAKVRYRALGVLLRLFTKDEAAVTPMLVKDEMVPLLIEARTQATYGDERNNAAETVLARIGEPAVEPVIALLTSQYWAADVLASIGAPAVPALTLALGSDDRDVRFAAADALVQIENTAPESVGALTTDLDKENLKSVATNYAYYIRLGQAGSEQILIRALNKYGDKEMALDYLNCGNSTLDEAARKWAANHGYTVYTTPGSASGPQWGEGN